jgi:hypothetical protein
LFNEDRPRRHHYLFARRELRAIAGRFAGRLPGLVRAGHMDAALAMASDQASSHLPPAGRLPHAGLGASLHDLEGRSVVLVTMPRPEHGAEAYFAAIVLAGGHLPGYLFSSTAGPPGTSREPCFARGTTGATSTWGMARQRRRALSCPRSKLNSGPAARNGHRSVSSPSAARGMCGLSALSKAVRIQQSNWEFDLME